MSGKWLELLKQIAPNVRRVAVLRDASNPTGIGQFGVIQGVAPSLGVEVSPVNMRDAGEIERAVTAFARVPNGGLVASASALTLIHRDLIFKLAASHRLPAVYPDVSTQPTVACSPMELIGTTSFDAPLVMWIAY